VHSSANYCATGWQDIVAVDDFSRADKAPNLEGKKLTARVERKRILHVVGPEREAGPVHLPPRCTYGYHRVRSDSIFDELNVRYSQRMWEACVKYGIPLVYASSGRYLR
jgi:ADP-L-glycero-D-manno-heptose 6-epimerase